VTVLGRATARFAAILLGLLVLIAVFADLLASEAPLLAHGSDGWLVLPAATQPARLRAVEPG